MATSQFMPAHKSDSNFALPPMLEEVPEVTLSLGSPVLKAYRVKYTMGGWDRFAAGDVLIVDQDQPAYIGDTIVSADSPSRAWFGTYRSGDYHRTGVVVETRKATEAGYRQAERRKLKPIMSAAQIVECIATETPKRPKGSSPFCERFDRSNLERLPRCQYFSSVTIAGGLGDVIVPASLRMNALLVEEGTNLIVSGSLKVSEDVIVRGSLSVDDKLECDDRLYVTGDFRTKGFVDCGRFLVGGDVQGHFTIAVKDYAAVGGSVDIAGGDDIRCVDLFVGGDLYASLWVGNAVVAGSLKSRGLVHVDNDLSVGRDLRAEEVEAGGRIAVGGTLWSKTVIAAGKTNQIACARRVRGRIKSGTLRELDPSAKTPKWGPQLLPIASRASVATIH